MSARILIIEDNPGNMDLMVYLLEAFGHTPLTAYDGAAGVAAALRENPQLIICDIHLPKLDGYGVIQTLRQHPDLAHTPILAVTALAMVGDREKIVAAGFDGYISKPIVPESFVGQVEAFLPDILRTRGIPPTDPETTDTSTSPPPAPGTRGHILVVNDLANNRELLRSILEPFGYRVTLTGNVRDALAFLIDQRCDLILSDLHMPDLDGWSFLKAVRDDAELRKIPFVFLSASTWSGKERELALSQGAARFIQSPIEPLALLAQIDDCLRGATA